MKDFLEKLEKDLTDNKKDLSKLSPEEQYKTITSRVFEVIKPDLLKKKLRTKKPLIVKYGIDPTGRDVHLGHIVPVLILSRLQRMGHQIVLVFGNFTALVGDPSGRVKDRPVLSEEEIKENVATYKDQFSRFLNFKKTKIVYNADLINKFKMIDLFKIYRNNRLSPLMQREDFRKRADGLSIAELLYPTLMALDSIALKADIEMGGKDQFLNFHTVVDFMESEGIEPESAITSELLLSLSGDGKKMSKSEGNYIGLNDEADDAYGKIMSMPDNQLEHYFKLLTEISNEDWQKLSGAMKQDNLNPMEVKKLLARLVVNLLHSAEKVSQAEASFTKVFSEDKLPDDIPEVKLDDTVKDMVDLLMAGKVVVSRTEARSLIESGAVGVVDGKKVTDIKTKPPKSGVVKIGKRRWIKIV